MVLWQSELTGFIASRSDVSDIIILESGLQLLIICKGSPAGIEKALRKFLALPPGWKVSLFEKDDLGNPAKLNALMHGFSIRQNKDMSEIFGLEKKAIVSYDLSSLGHSKKTIFGYALKGRGGKSKAEGMLQNISGETIGRNSVLVPNRHLAKITEFLAFWDVKLTVKDVLISKANAVKKLEKPEGGVKNGA